MRRHSPVSACLVIAAFCLSAAGAATAGPNGRELLRSTAPGAYSVRYLPDRALVSTSTQQQTELAVFLPQPPLWAYVDGEAHSAAAFAWDADAQTVTVALGEGRHCIEIGWAGDGARPPTDIRIPVISEGKRLGALDARFDLDGMTAQGSIDLPRGVARVWLTPCGEPFDAPVKLSVGSSVLSEWRATEGRLRATKHIAVGGELPLRLSAEAFNLPASPFAAVEIEPLSAGAAAVRVDAMPESGIVVEAEDFVDQGGNTVMISEGAHLDQHAGKSIYSFQGDGHWLEWEFDVPEAGDYNLFARISCGEEMSYRKVTVDGQTPARGFRLVEFPGTGGWAHAPGEWWAMQVAGGSEELPPLKLDAGKHRLRLEGVFRYHLNIDYFVISKR